ncbi:2-oxoglutarate dehydrogenase complex dihydrolipoyllysine-residue succinyltransferase [Rubrobacter aplysinae]|uniref:2-oxoglutarate dehydrogenase complex dihydrolipoyllysine-residue succinyltransferase n=1 Tax=Rubrobacter aplysinae TaxID=909625 RepID=UPI00064BF2E6|nr:2-oxoglutarate dehydrogenase complex dihydrolipoyllysine-residue succinyltransferase [Rubrobacter aplysinae]
MPEIHVPELGESVTEATVGQWMKQEGEAVSAGETLVELETDKINFEVEAEEDGVLEKISHPEGDEVTVGEALGTIGEGSGQSSGESGGGDAQSEKDEQAESSGGSGEPEQGAQESQQSSSAATAGTTGETGAAGTEGSEANGHREPEEVSGRASPAVRKLAEEYGIDLASTSGSGTGGRITKEDVERLIRSQSGGGQAAQEAPASAPASTQPSGDGQSAAPAPSEDGRAHLEERVRLSRRRQTIAQRLVEAQQNAAMLTTFNEVDMSAVMELRKRRKDDFQERTGVKLGFMSFFTKASIGALKSFPEINAELQGTELVYKNYYDIGMAVNTEEGLVVPVVRDADNLSFAGIEQEIGDLATKARDGKLGLQDLQGGTFTITNGGIFGSLISTPILNAPQSAILGMHKIQERPVAVDGQVEIRPMMYLALSYDHRVVDGRGAVSFLVRIKELIEDPESLLLEG